MSRLKQRDLQGRFSRNLMAKVTINKSLLNRKLQDLKRSQISRINRSGILNDVLKDLKSEIRRGINPQTGRPYKRLAKSTIENRSRYSSVNNTHSSFKASLSNVTFTGQLLDSLKQTITSFRKNIRITIRATGTHQGYSLIKGGRTKSVLNSNLVSFLKDKGFPVLNISKNRIDILRRKIVRKLNRA